MDCKFLFDILEKDDIETLKNTANLEKYIEYILWESRYDFPKCLDFSIKYFLEMEYKHLPPQYKNMFLEDTKENRLFFLFYNTNSTFNYKLVKMLGINYGISLDKVSHYNLLWHIYKQHCTINSISNTNNILKYLEAIVLYTNINIYDVGPTNKNIFEIINEDILNNNSEFIKVLLSNDSLENKEPEC